MMEFLKNHGSRLILLAPLLWLSFDWLISGKIIAFILTSIFIIIVIFGLWQEDDQISDEEE